MLDVPTYDLYGEPGARQDADFLHCETIEDRSRLHDYRIAAHRHDQLLQLLFLAEGSGDVSLDGVRSALVPPCLVIVPATVVHGFSFSNIVTGLVLTLYQSHLEGILHTTPQAAQAVRSPAVLLLSGQTEAARAIADALKAIAVEFTGHAAGRLAIIEAHLAIVAIMIHRACLVTPAADSLAGRRGRTHAVRFREMIDRDFQARATVDDYARRLGVTPVHLRRLCREHLGTTPLGALNARAILEAKRLLVFSSLDVKQIAASIGFDDPAYFSRFFQRATGLAPSAFRARRHTTVARLPSAGLSPGRAGMPPETGR